MNNSRSEEESRAVGYPGFSFDVSDHTTTENFENKSRIQTLKTITIHDDVEKVFLL